MEYSLTCVCGNVIAIKKEALGKRIRCKLCMEISSIPIDLKSIEEEKKLATSAQQEPMANPINEIVCKFCAESIPKDSRICPKCNEVLIKKSKFKLSAEETNDLFKQHLKALDEISSQAPKKYFPLYTSSIILLAITVFLIIGSLGSLFAERPEMTLTVVLAIIAAFFGILFYTVFQSDKKSINIQKEKDPIKFIKQYFKGLKSYRRGVLYDAVSPLGKKNTSVKDYPFKQVAKDKMLHNMSTLKGFLKYWSSNFSGFDSVTRSGVIKSAKDIRIVEEHEDKVVIEINFLYSSYNRSLLFLILLSIWIAFIAIYITTKKESITIRKTIIKHNDKWYVAEGELQGNLDLATFKPE